MTNYRKRIADKLLDEHLHTFGAVLIDGPRGCGKTTTALQVARSAVAFQNPGTKDNLLYTAENDPMSLTDGETPRLFDEWQDAPQIWDAVRTSVDERGGKGLYILTGSSSQSVTTAHTGTGRISSFTMWPMSLYESEESNGTVSLGSLFDDPEGFVRCRSDLTVADLTYAICRGGWPECVFDTDRKYRLAYSKNLYKQICSRDVTQIDGKKKNPDWTKAAIKSYARNICSTASEKTVISDVTAMTGMSRNTVSEYIAALRKLYVLEDIPAWCPDIRSKTTMRSSPKHNIVDPSIAAAALGVGPDYFKSDFRTLGFLFECLCMRDLKIYSSPMGGEVSYYRDRYGLEADCVVHLDGGEYALVEFKMGQSEIPKAVEHLCEIERLIKAHDDAEEDAQLRIGPPTFKAVLTGTQYGFRTKEGVLVIPIGCLKD